MAESTFMRAPAPQPKKTLYTEAMEIFHHAADVMGLDPRVRVIHKPNGGLSDARNAGIAGATDLGGRRTVLVVDVAGIIGEVAGEPLPEPARTA